MSFTVQAGFRKEEPEEEEEKGVSFIGPLDSFQESGSTCKGGTGSRSLGRDKQFSYPYLRFPLSHKGGASFPHCNLSVLAGSEFLVSPNFDDCSPTFSFLCKLQKYFGFPTVRHRHQQASSLLYPPPKGKLNTTAIGFFALPQPPKG